QLRPEVVAGSPAHAVAIPGILSGGSYPSRWFPADREPLTPRAPLEPLAPLAPLAPFGPSPSIRPLIPLGQFRDTFIVAVDDQGIAIIDQHVAHERVLFERVMERLTSGAVESQRLLVPMVLELTPAAHDTLIGRAAARERLGVEPESF